MDAIPILIIEDDDIDVMAIKRAMKKAGLKNPTIRATDGQAALDILQSGDPELSIDKPFVITLDLNMPRMDGLTFLKTIRQDEKLKRAIVFILTTSTALDDINNAYSHHVAGYLVKHDARSSYKNLAELIKIYCQSITFPIIVP